MLIRRVVESGGAGEQPGSGEGEADGVDMDRVSSQDYQTASELFELMTKNRHFDDTDDDSLTTQDLVLLYENIGVGTRLMRDANEEKRRKPNQHVETIVYNDEPESDSDISENFSSDDIHHVFKINQERLNIFNNGSLDNILCSKLGGLEIQSSDLSTEYNRQFLFKDPYIKEQLKGLNLMSNGSQFDNIFPTSLLDYICCKRLEDNYTFYMENIIRYVQHTIEQLKRISNGDFLTDRAKEKWEEVNNKDISDNTKVLATSTSIPLHVECKKAGNATWDDIVHSEVDVRSLSKILEKKIIVEIPKLVCGSFRLFSKRCADNLVISCKREKKEGSADASRVDVVLKLQRSQTGQVISNISSIMILQSAPAVQDLHAPEIIPIEYPDQTEDRNGEENIASELKDEDDSNENTVTVVECANEKDNPQTEVESENNNIDIENVTEKFYIASSSNSNMETNDYPISDAEFANYGNYDSNQYSSESSIALRDILDQTTLFQVRDEASFKLVSPDELRVTMQRLNMQAALPEESGEDVFTSVGTKRKSPVRIRIKSPYENKSYALEEKKRKRLLEIREKREKRKIALGENCKVSKHKYTKQALTPQASNSVTKLSITNKSFYNSIYGQGGDNKTKSNSRKSMKNNLILEVPIEQIQEEYCESPENTPETSKKYVNRSYYLDDAETAMMYMQRQGDDGEKNTCFASTSAVSNDFSSNLTAFAQLIGPSDTSDISKEDTPVTDDRDHSIDDDIFNNSKDAGCSYDNCIPQEYNMVPENTPKEINEIQDNDRKVLPTVECRKSIDKLYDLMKIIGKKSNIDLRKSTSKLNVEKLNAHIGTGGSTIQGSDSGTSLKHHLTSSNPSCFSFGKMNSDNPRSKASRNKTGQAATVVPKVIISSKVQPQKIETDKLKKERKRVIISPPPKSVPENPLKAISQLLHDFDNVQKNRLKSTPDAKLPKKVDIIPNDGKPSISRRRYSRIDQNNQNQDKPKVPITSLRETRRLKPLTPVEMAKIPRQQTVMDDKKKKITDIIDEAKEARGEAVRGPSKLNSRLNSLAQPKRSYVQAHSEEYQNRYGKNLMADRLQRLATAASPPVMEHANAIARSPGSPTAKSRAKRETTTSCVSVKQPPLSVQPIEKPDIRACRSTSSSPNRKSPTQRPKSSTLNHTASDAPETVKKMVAVQSYVARHYGRASAGDLLPSGHKSRVPLLPSDLEVASMTSSPTIEEANELGKKLHHLIDSMISTANPIPSPLSLSEDQPSTADNLRDEISIVQETDSDFNIDILADADLQTAVGDGQRDQFCESPDALDHLKSCNSTTELRQLESALYNQISGAFQKRLRIKNLTLTPKQSMQRVFLLQSGDAGSLLVKSTVSQIKCDAQSLHELKAVPVLSNSHLNWNFAQIPMQLTTVGYAFPVHRPDRSVSNLGVESLSVSSIKASEHSSCVSKSCKSDKINQCFRGSLQESRLERAAQAELDEDNITASKVNEIVEKSSKEVVEVPIVEVSDVDETITNPDETVTNPDETLMNSDETNVSIAITEVCDCKDCTTSSRNNVDCTTSLDMLVGLLNEIQKITCQNPGQTAPHCAELETILSNAAVTEKKDSPREIVSITSLDRLRHLESNPSIYSFYISSEGSPSIVPSNLSDPKPLFVDKEVYVNLCDKEVVSRFTDVPSLVLPIVHHGTNVTNSLIGVISEPSTANQSMISLNDYHSFYSNAFFNSQSIKRIIELPHVESTEKLKEIKKTDLNEKICKNESLETRIQCQKISHQIKKYPVNSLDFDPNIKMKRDILVTLYSILVFTVFAALSFPDMVIFEE